MNKVVLNTLALYLNMAVTMVVTLLGVRYVLQVLGGAEYGIYILLSSIVLMFSFINVGMAASTQRYLSFDLGRNRHDALGETFYTSLLVHLMVVAVLGTSLLSVGSVLIWTTLNIPSSLLWSAQGVLLCMTGGIITTVVAAPYEGAMNAHEDIYVIAGINVLEAVLKLGAALALFWITGNRLVIYAVLIMCVQTNSYVLKRWYARSKYAETHYRWHRLQQRDRLKEMGKFAVWSLIGQGSSIARYQGVAILVNIFFGVLVNAAYGIAQQVYAFLLFFANSIVRPLRPLIVKKEGAGAHARMLELSYTACRFSFLMLSLVIVPLYVNMPLVLDVWLKEVPEGSLFFARAFLIVILLNQLTIGLQVALDSTGRIRRLQTIMGFFDISPLLVGYVLFTCGFSPESIMVVVIVEEAVGIFVRVDIARRDAGLQAGHFLLHVALPCLLTVALAFALAVGVAVEVTNPWLCLVTTTVLSVVLLALLGYRCCLAAWERERVKGLLLAAWHRLGL